MPYNKQTREQLISHYRKFSEKPKNGIVITDKYLDEGLTSFWKDVVRR